MDLVVGASNHAVKSLVNKLGSLLAREYALIHGVRDEIQYITDELASMQAFLIRLKQAPGNHNVQRLDWMKQVREVSYDIEDCVDDVDHRLSSEPRGSGVLVYFRKKWYLLTTLYARHCIATEIGNLKTRAQHVSERRMRYGVKELDNDDDDGPGATAHRDRPSLPPKIVGTKEPLGIEKGMAKLQKWFDEGKQSQSAHGESRFFAIAGSGGLGKTTLAMAFYHKVGFEFDRRAYVLASQKFDLQAVLRSLIKQFHEQQGDASQNPVGRIEELDDIKELKSKLDEQRQEKRYMILVDDIWSVSAWENLRDCLPRGGSIVVTTRFNSVAVACSRGQGEFDKLEPLSDESSSSLFFETISSITECQELDTVEKDVILRCTRNLPLSIVLVAGLVATKVKSDLKPNVNEPKPKVSGHLKMVEEALNSFLGFNLPTVGVTEILNHCYKDLPADLKTCLLYLSMFPKGCLISRKSLIRRWIAEGFIAEEQGNTVEEVAEDCFNELISRNLVRAVNSSSNGKLKSCQIHDMVLEYIVAKSSNENFITVVGGHWHTPFPSYKVRRLSVQRSDGKEMVEKMKLSHVRSLIVLGSLRVLHSTLHKFQILKVLDLEGCTDLSNKQLKKICKMHQLKYLSLRRTDVKEMPTKISRLESLEVLDIRDTSIEKLPESVNKLQRMEHLLAGNKNKRHALKLTEGITKMTALQTLSGVEICADLATEVLRDLQKLTSLRKFTIYKISCTTPGSGNYEYGLLLSAIEHLCSCFLKNLAIDDNFTGFLDTLNNSQAPPEHLQTLGLSGKLSQVPKWIVSLHNLEKLTLSLTSLTTDALLKLAKLPELFSLIFSLDSTRSNTTALKMLQDNTLKSGGNIYVPPEGFQKLKLLRFAAPVLPPLSFLEGAMPVLQRIELRFRMVESVYGLENLSRIQQVVLTVSSQAPKDAKEKARQVKEVASMIDGLSVVLDEYNESTEQK